MLTIGCHLSSSKGYFNMAKTAVSLDANTFQFFTRNPRGGKAKAIDPKDIEVFTDYVQEQGIDTILAHAPYTLNAASKEARIREFALLTLEDDLLRMEHTPNQLYNFHPGSYTKQTLEIGIDNVAELLNAVLKPEQTTTVLLETMVGKGTEIGGKFEDLQAIIQRVELDNHVGVCLDTCHVWDGGYDIANNLEGVLEQFDQVIGLDRLKAIHVNDSLNECGARKDRHARIGEGRIGAEALIRVVNHPSLRNLPFFLETPQEDISGYAKEIALFREARSFDD